MAIEWLDYISKKDNIIIKHALNDGEFIIPDTKFKADGYCYKTNTIYEFNGDYWHGNLDIYNENDKSFYGKTFKELYDKTIDKENIIKSLGYNLVVM